MWKYFINFDVQGNQNHCCHLYLSRFLRPNLVSTPGIPAKNQHIFSLLVAYNSNLNSIGVLTMLRNLILFNSWRSIRPHCTGYSLAPAYFLLTLKWQHFTYVCFAACLIHLVILDKLPIIAHSLDHLTLFKSCVVFYHMVRHYIFN